MDNPYRGKHHGFIESNRELFTRETPLAYQRSGRGFWFAVWPEQPDTPVALQYHDAGGLEVLRGETRRAVSSIPIPIAISLHLPGHQDLVTASATACSMCTDEDRAGQPRCGITVASG
jgi:hypothetical protein